LIIFIVIISFYYFNLHLTPGIGPAGPDVPGKPFNRLWSDKKILLLGLGDSVTAGFGASKGLSYFDRLMENSPNDCKDMLGKNLSKVFPNLKTKNLALSGSNSLHHLRKIQSLEVHPSDFSGIVVMTTGGNDLIHNYGRALPKEGAMYGATFDEAKSWIDNFKNRLDQMILILNKKFPGGCHIFLANIYDPSDGTGNTSSWLTGLPYWPDGLKILKDYNETISLCADKYDFVHLVNIYDTFLGHGIHCKKFWIRHYHFKDPHYWYFMNIEDPSERGYDAIRRLFLLEMIETLPNSFSSNKK